MKITRTLKLGLLTALVCCSSLGLTGCGGSDNTGKSSEAEIQAFKGNPDAPGAQAEADRMKAEAATQSAKAQSSAQQAPPAPAPK